MTLSEYPGQCSCDTGYFISNKSHLICQKCHESCQSCLGIFDSDCITCKNYERMPQNTPTKCECAANQYVESNNPFICDICDSSCSSCFGPNANECLTCSDLIITFDASHPFCVCIDGFYVAQKSPIRCNACLFDCETCTDSASCETCTDDRFMIQNRCACKKGTYDFNNICKECDFKCQTCSISMDYCDLCYDGYVLTDNFCVCPLGYGGLNCNLKASLEVSDVLFNDIITLKFSEDLLKALEIDDFKLSVISNLDIKVSFTLLSDSPSIYNLHLTFTPKYFSVEAELNVKIKNQIYGKQSGAGLANTSFKYNLSNHKYDKPSMTEDFFEDKLSSDVQKALNIGSLVNASINSFILKDFSSF